MVDEPNGRRGGAEEDFSVGMRHNALEFDLADVDEDRMLDFEGECSLILTHAPCSQMCLVLSDHALHVLSSARSMSRPKAEFCAFVKTRERGPHSNFELRSRFDALDADHSGKIDIHEFIRFSLRMTLLHALLHV